jgi:hypothetical protein
LELLAVILVAVNNMIPWGLLGQGVKAGLEIYKNKKAADVAMSEAKLLHIEKMKRGEIEFSGKISENQKLIGKMSLSLSRFHLLYFC